MASYHNLDGADVKVDTPVIANILPILSMGITSFFVYRKTKSIGSAIGYGALAAVIGFLPRYILIKKAVRDATAAYNKSQSAPKPTPAPAPVVDAPVISNADGEIIVSPEDVLTVIEQIAVKNNKHIIFATKKNFFLKTIKKFSRRERSAAYEVCKLVYDIPSEPTQENIDTMLSAMADLEDKYGKEFLEAVNKRLQDISNEISSEPKKTKSKNITAA
jgi:hypothetical protein